MVGKEVKVVGEVNQALKVQAAAHRVINQLLLLVETNPLPALHQAKAVPNHLSITQLPNLKVQIIKNYYGG